MLEIPRRPKPPQAPEPDVALETNGTHTHATGKRKRGDEDEPLTNGHIAKKIAGESTAGDQELIVVDDGEDEREEGAILIDD